ncbi:MAG TPA: phosphatase PAP2 family protein [Candidatus Cloacimonadota bacterium]|nr:phosphatase PAP2 family protein [Candidatus Cloacimonadota bacterium]HPT72835.1 phosphatase PAP2 family protein [Candidatus Cloacimonadota bacterium]
MEDKAYPRSWIWMDFLIPSLILAITTILFRIFPIDIEVSKHFYQAGSGWILKDSHLWNLFYHFGNIPALLMTLSALFLFAYSFQKLGMVQYRKIAIFFILLMILGPGLVINTFLKDHWGRPRPRDIVDFGGKAQYEKVLSIDRESHGKSFPCGHASMGFYLFAPFFTFRRKHPVRATFFLLLGLVMGGLIGYARIVQGGHFLSDVIFTGGLMYMIAAFIFYLLNLHEFLMYVPKEEVTPAKVQWMQVAVLFMSLLIILGVVFATPYEKDKTFTGLDKYIDECRKAMIQMVVPAGNVDIRTSDWFNFHMNVSGFGFPGCKVDHQLWETLDHITYQASYFQKKKGIFTELNQNLEVYLPINIPTEYWLTLDKGRAEMTVDSTIASQTWTVLVKEGDCIVHVKQGQLVHIYAETRGKRITKQYGYTITPNPASKIPMISMKIYLKDGDLFLP